MSSLVWIYIYMCVCVCVCVCVLNILNGFPKDKKRKKKIQ